MSAIKVTRTEAAELLDAALAYAARGLPVFPLQPFGKKPATPRGLYNATANPVTVRRMWRIADRNIGMPTSTISGFWVVGRASGPLGAALDRLAIIGGRP